jgi:hypothetical protein
MSDTFKYLGNKEGKAQDFLKGKMETVANASEGVIPGGDAYKKYDKNPSASSDSSSDKTRGFGQDSDSGRNYASGAWGSGDLDAAGLAAKYKLDTSQEGRGDGHIWGRNADGSEVYIGKSSMDLASNKDLIANHSGQANSEEDDHSSLSENLSSAGDIKGAILTEWAGGNDTLKEAEPEKERTPIEHSPEIKEAKERVRSYEDSVLSGQLSNDIYGNSNYVASDDFQADYQLELNKGQVGAGSEDSGEEPSAIATDSFLANKKTDVKKEYQFQPK